MTDSKSSAPAILDDAATLMDLYFTTETPAERDVVFEQLAALHTPVVDTFLHAMLEEDDDDHMRLAAACELAKRNRPEGIQYLEEQLDEPISLGFFLRAIDILAEVRGVVYYDRFSTIWHDHERDQDERRQAMMALEDLDPVRALQDYATYVTHFAEDLNHIHEDQLQAAALAFARHANKDGMKLLQQLKDPIARSTTLQDEEKTLLQGLIDEAIRWQ